MSLAATSLVPSARANYNVVAESSRRATFAPFCGAHEYYEWEFSRLIWN